ncbi:hypothetical protein LRN66_15495, partial [Staphylococcus aureus]|nr:hypothetical protein [Staphylococcus aureus]
ELVMLLLACGLIAVTCYVALRAATPISRMLGQTGINIVNRVMGMVLAAVTVEVIVNGLYRLFPMLNH